MIDRAPELFLDGRVALHAGDCLDVLRALPAESVHAVITDPPYHLTSIVKRFGGAAAAPARDYSGEKAGATGAYARASRGFMGKTWDGGDIAFRVELWSEVFRVLKPGGFCAAFSATRTYHRMAVAIEDAGFEIRDCLAWMYGTGFPKSLDVSKAMQRDRRSEDEPRVRAICRFIRSAMDAAGLVSRDLAAEFACHARLIDHWAARDTDSQPMLPTAECWAALKQRLSLPDDMDALFGALDARRAAYADAWTDAAVTGEIAGEPGGFGDHRFSAVDRTLRELSPEAREWQGWGTALKPAFEPICLARKPLAERNVAANVLAHGCGALNIDAARIGFASEADRAAAAAAAAAAVLRGRQAARNVDGWGMRPQNFTADDVAASAAGRGRWPANVVHDGSPEVMAAFPDSAGQLRAVGPEFGARPAVNVYGDYGPRQPASPRGDSGSAARFFFSAKASKFDRIKSKHPTVKPVELMRWLVRLLAPPGGIVLDPFAGTGTTGQAAYLEGFSAVLIEREAEYRADIARRMALTLAGPEEKARALVEPAPHDDLPLFGG